MHKLIAHEISLNTTQNSTTPRKENDQKDQSKTLRQTTSINFTNNNSKRVSFPDDQSSIGGLEDEEDNNECDQSFVSITTTSSVVDNKVMKRKIVR